MIYLYILESKTPVPEHDAIAWGKWFETADRTVALTELPDCNISTVFLGTDCQIGGGPPLLFETKVFSGEFDDRCRRYSTWDEAEAGHAEMVALVLAKGRVGL